MQLPGIEKAAREAGHTILTPLVSLDTPGKATVEVVILADPVSLHNIWWPRSYSIQLQLCERLYGFEAHQLPPGKGRVFDLPST